MRRRAHVCWERDGLWAEGSAGWRLCRCPLRLLQQQQPVTRACQRFGWLLLAAASTAGGLCSLKIGFGAGVGGDVLCYCLFAGSCAQPRFGLEEREAGDVMVAPPELQEVRVPAFSYRKNRHYFYTIYMCVYIFSAIWSLLQSGLKGLTFSKFR